MLIPFILGLASCGPKMTLLKFEAPETRFTNIGETPELQLVVDKGALIYFKIVHFNKDWQLDRSGDNILDVITAKKGYHLGDNKGPYGYDLTRTFSTMGEALQAGMDNPRSYGYTLGSYYRLNGNRLYRIDGGTAPVSLN